MIYLLLLYNDFKSLYRNPVFEKHLMLKLLSYLGLSILSIFFLVIGISLNKVLFRIWPDKDISSSFFLILIYILAIDLFIRYLFQSITFFINKSYFLLPIKKSKLINNLLIKSICNFFNIYLLLITVPFALIAIMPTFGTQQMTFFVFGIVLLILLNNFLVFLIKTIAKQNVLFSLIPLFLLIIIFCGKIFYSVQFGEITLKLCNLFLEGYFLIFIAITLVLVGIIYFTHLLLNRLFYSESDSLYKIKNKYFKYNFLNNFKESSSYLMLEIKLILRNKRVRLNFFMSLFWMSYALFFILINEYSNNNDFITVLWLTILLGSFSFLHGHYLLSWQSSFFAFIVTSNFSIHKYFKILLNLFLFSIILIGVISFPILYKNNGDVFLFISVWSYVAGFGNYIIFANALYNYSPIELNKLILGNWQGTGINQIVTILIITGIPVGTYFIFLFFFSILLYKIFLFTLGLSFIFSKNHWITSISKKIYKNKYKFYEHYKM